MGLDPAHRLSSKGLGAGGHAAGHVPMKSRPAEHTASMARPGPALGLALRCLIDGPLHRGREAVRVTQPPRARARMAAETVSASHPTRSATMLAASGWVMCRSGEPPRSAPGGLG
jgi:hypothetical protein